MKFSQHQVITPATNILYTLQRLTTVSLKSTTEIVDLLQYICKINHNKLSQQIAPQSWQHVPNGCYLADYSLIKKKTIYRSQSHVSLFTWHNGAITQSFIITIISCTHELRGNFTIDTLEKNELAKIKCKPCSAISCVECNCHCAELHDSLVLRHLCRCSCQCQLQTFLLDGPETDKSSSVASEQPLGLKTLLHFIL